MNKNYYRNLFLFLINTLLLYIPLLALTDRQTYIQTDRQRNEYTCFAWAGGTFFPVVLYVCCVSFWLWREKGFGLHTHVLLRVQTSTKQLWCCVSFLVAAGNRFWCHVHTYLVYNTVVQLCQFLDVAGNSSQNELNIQNVLVQLIL